MDQEITLAYLVIIVYLKQEERGLKKKKQNLRIKISKEEMPRFVQQALTPYLYCELNLYNKL